MEEASRDSCFSGDIDALVGDVLTSWVSELRSDAARNPRTNGRGLAERNLLRTVIRAADCETPDEAALRALTLAASRYGAMQPMHRVDPGEVARQFACLRREIARVAAARETHPDETLRFLHRIDAALSVATLAVIRAGHRR